MILSSVPAYALAMPYVGEPWLWTVPVEEAELPVLVEAPFLIPLDRERPRQPVPVSTRTQRPRRSRRPSDCGLLFKPAPRPVHLRRHRRAVCGGHGPGRHTLDGVTCAVCLRVYAATLAWVHAVMPRWPTDDPGLVGPDGVVRPRLYHAVSAPYLEACHD